MTAELLPFEARPRVQLSQRLSEIHADVDSAAGVIGGDGGVYQRDGELVRVIHIAELDAQKAQVAPGSPVIRTVPPAIMTERLTRLARFQKWDGRKGKGGDWVDCAPPKALVSALLERGEWSKVRPLVGITETPVFRFDGTVMQQPGYDARTGYLYEPTIDFPTVPKKPTKDDAVAALAALTEVWSEMEWAQEADGAVPVAATLTMLARSAILGPSPAFLTESSVRGAGKTLTNECAGLIAHGRRPAMLTWPDSADELEKMLGGLAVQGAQVVMFDNVESAFGGGPLDKVLTCADRVALRVLGKSEVVNLSWVAVVLATGNNVPLKRDIVRRILVARQEPTTEKPEQREGFKHDPLGAWVLQERPRLVVAGLTLLRAYLLAGAPSQGLRRMGTFELWQNLIPNAIAWAGGPDILECLPSANGGDEEGERLAALIAGWERLDAPGNGLTIKSALATLYPSGSQHDDGPPDAYEGLRNVLEAMAPPRKGWKPDPVRLGHGFRRFKGRVMGGKKLVDVGSHAGTKSWAVRSVQG